MAREKADYGQDAPGIRLGMLGIGLGGALAGGAAALWGGSFLAAPVAGIVQMLCLLATVYGFGMAIYMTWGSRVGKVRTCERLLEEVARVRPWSGGETVADVGCGRGLMLIRAARNLTTGQALGIDIWRSADQTGNAPDATLRNAEIEGVADRVDIRTGDATALPLETGSCDVVLSNWVVHNIEDEKGQQAALREMWRVCRPGGVIVVSDIANLSGYRRQFVALGASDIRFFDGGLEARIANIVSGGTYKPQALVLRR